MRCGTRSGSGRRLFDFDGAEALTFDCFGTIVDWERGITAALQPLLPGVDAEARLDAYGEEEAAIESGRYLRYRIVLGEAAARVATRFGVTLSKDEKERFAASLVDWPAFPDSAAALKVLRARFKLGLITNCDDDLIAETIEHLGVTFDWVVTAEQARSYKPSERNFMLAFERIGLPRERIVHVAQSLYHDHVPAKRLGLRTVWVNRRAGKPGGATPPAEAKPDWEVPGLASLLH